MRFSAAPGASRAPDAVDVILVVVRNIVVEHRANVLHVDAAGGHIGGDQHAQTPHFEVAHHARADGLAHLAVQTGGGKACLRQVFHQLIHHAAGVAEHHRAPLPVALQQQVERLHLLRLRDVVEELLDGVQRALPAVDRHQLWIALEILRQRQDRGRHRGGEQQRLALLGRGGEDFADVIYKAHVEHLVSLVQHHGFQLVQQQRAAPHVIHDAPRRAHHDGGRAKP